MSKDLSFSQRMKQGWSKEELMNYYCLSDNEYFRIMVCLSGLKKS